MCKFIICLFLSVFLLNGCSAPTGETSSSSPVSSSSSEAEKPVDSEPEESSVVSEPQNDAETGGEHETETLPGTDISTLSLDEYLSVERYVTKTEGVENKTVRYYIGKNGNPSGIIYDYSELTDHNVYSNVAGNGYEMILEGDYRFLYTVPNEWVYLLDTSQNWYRMPFEGGEPELLFTLDADWEYYRFAWNYGGNFYGIYDQGLLVCDTIRAGESQDLFSSAQRRMLAHDLSTGETYVVGEHTTDFSVFWLLTNYSYFFRLPMESEEAQMTDEGYYIYSGAEGKVYSVDVSKLSRPIHEIILERDVEEIFPLDESGKPIIGDFLTEVNFEEAGLAPTSVQ